MSKDDDPLLLKFLGYLFTAILVWLLGAAILWGVFSISSIFHIPQWLSFLILGTALSWGLFIYVIASGRFSKNAKGAGGAIYSSFLLIAVAPILLSAALWSLAFCGSFIWAFLSYLTEFTGQVYRKY